MFLYIPNFNILKVEIVFHDSKENENSAILNSSYSMLKVKTLLISSINKTGLYP